MSVEYRNIHTQKIVTVERIERLQTFPHRPFMVVVLSDGSHWLKTLFDQEHKVYKPKQVPTLPLPVEAERTAEVE